MAIHQRRAGDRVPRLGSMHGSVRVSEVLEICDHIGVLLAEMPEIPNHILVARLLTSATRHPLRTELARAMIVQLVEAMRRRPMPG